MSVEKMEMTATHFGQRFLQIHRLGYQAGKILHPWPKLAAKPSFGLPDLEILSPKSAEESLKG